MRLYLFLLVFCGTSIALFAETFDLEESIEEWKNHSAGDFLEQFPFAEYLKGKDVGDVRQLEKDKHVLKANGINGDYFILYLFQYYLRQQDLPFGDVDRLKALFQLANSMSQSEKYLPDSIYVYQAISDLIFSTLADSLESKIKNGQLNPVNFEVKYMLRRLEDNQYYINITPTKWKKAWNNIQQGNWSYLWHKATSTYFQEFLLMILSGATVFLLGGWVFIRQRRKHKKGTKVVKSALAVLGGLLILCSWGIPKNERDNNKLSEISCNRAFDNQVEIKELTFCDKIYGHSIWMNATNNLVKTKYFAYKSAFANVSSRQDIWKAQKEVILQTNGAYSGFNSTIPVGLTIDNGKVVNQFWERNMDALVLIYDGRLEVLNTNQKYWLEPMQRSVNISRYRDKLDFIQWTKAKKATVFQTHLLAFENNLKISSKGFLKSASRKLLAILTDGSDTNYYVFFTIPKGEFLFEASQRIFDYLYIQKGFDVHAMINLETGLHNLLEVDSSIKQCRGHTLKGSGNVKRVANVLSFYME